MTGASCLVIYCIMFFFVIRDFEFFVSRLEVSTPISTMRTSFKAYSKALARQIRQWKDKINRFGLSCLSRLIQCSSGYSSLLVLSLLHLLNNECFSPVPPSHREYNDALANGSDGILSFIIAGCQVRLRTYESRCGPFLFRFGKKTSPGRIIVNSWRNEIIAFRWSWVKFAGILFAVGQVEQLINFTARKSRYV